MSDNVYIEAISLVTGLYEGKACPLQLEPNTNSDWFNPNGYLGSKGHKYYSSSVKYVLAAANSLSSSPDISPEKSGISIASNSIDLEGRKIILENISGVDAPIGAAFAPNCSVNIAAGMLAEKLGYKGASFTFTGGADASIMALWQAQKLVADGDLEQIIVGQVEHAGDHKYLSGASLWRLSRKPSNQLASGIKGICRLRNSGKNLDLSGIALPNNQNPIYIIGEKNSALQNLANELTRHNFACEHVCSDAVKLGVHPDMYLQFMMSLMAWKKLCCNIFLVSDSGHIFYFQLNHKGKIHDKDNTRKYLNYQRVGV